MLWKAATYMKPREAWGCVPALYADSTEVVENNDKAKVFMDCFFPRMDEPDGDPPIQAPLELPWPPKSWRAWLLEAQKVLCCWPWRPELFM